MAPARSLLPSPSQLRNLPEATVQRVIELADQESQRSARYAMFGMACGTVSFLGALASCVYLVMQGHDTAAGLVFGSTVVTIVGNMIRSR